VKSARTHDELLARKILENERIAHVRGGEIVRSPAVVSVADVLVDRGIRHSFEECLRAPALRPEIDWRLVEHVQRAMLSPGPDLAGFAATGRGFVAVPRSFSLGVVEVGGAVDDTLLECPEQPRAAANEGGAAAEAEACASDSAPASETTTGTIAARGIGPQGAAASPITPREALRHEELAVTRRFASMILVATPAVLVAVLLLGGDSLAQQLVVAGVAALMAGLLWLRRLLATPGRYIGFHAAACWGVCTLGALAAVYYAGALSAAPALLGLGIYVIAMGPSRAAAWMVYGMCAAFHAGLAALILMGWVADAGIMTLPASLTLRDAAIIQVLVQLCLLGALVLGRSSRSARLRALSELERSKREVVERQGLLEEARDDLDRALRLGESGRFTERRVGWYRLGALIGRGAMGDVYEAAHAETGSLAAIKLIKPELLESAETRRRFARELAIAASLKVPNVVRVLDMSEPDAPLPYLAMERLFGHNLSHHVRGGAKLPPDEALTLAQHVGRGIDAAARAGIIHRDLKPQNVFLHEPPLRQPLWKILDFGVSKLAESGDTLTQGRVIGTPAYMAPEQAQAGAIDSRADVYALGAILYRVLTGRKPFSEGDVAKTIFAVVYTMPPRPSELAELSPEVDAVLAVALAKHPASRFQSGLELAAALREALAGKLAPATRARADALALELPWGASTA
jgi:eukaryotic-like serine/threonine-protein kinase